MRTLPLAYLTSRSNQCRLQTRALPPLDARKRKKQHSGAVQQRPIAVMITSISRARARSRRIRQKDNADRNSYLAEPTPTTYRVAAHRQAAQHQIALVASRIFSVGTSRGGWVCVRRITITMMLAAKTKTASIIAGLLWKRRCCPSKLDLVIVDRIWLRRRRCVNQLLYI